MSSKKIKDKTKIKKENTPLIKTPEKENTHKVLSFFEKMGKKINNKKNFYLLILVLTILLLGLRVSIPVNGSGDDIIDYHHGKLSYNFFTSLGKDTNFKSSFHIFGTDFSDRLKTEKYYSGGVHMLAFAIAKWFNIKEVLLPRQILATIITIIILIFIGLIIQQILNWTWAIIGVLLFINTPFMIFLGVSFGSLKDMPFMLGNVLFLYSIILFYKNIPNIKNSTYILFLISMFVATLGRIGSILFFFYFSVFILLLILFSKKTIKDWLINKNKFILVLLKIFLSMGVGFFIALSIGYFNFWIEGFNHIINGIKVFTKFPQQIPVLFNGSVVYSTEIPANYLIINLLYTLPLFILIISIVGIWAFLRFIYKEDKKTMLIFILFCFIFPIWYIIYTSASVYDKWRHIAFTYPFLLIFGVWGLTYISKIKSNFIKIGITISIIILFTKTLVWNVQHYPFQTAYFNELIGGTEGAWLQQELDPQQQGVRPCFEYLLKEKDFKNLLNKRDSNNPIVIACFSQGLDKEYMGISPLIKNKIKIVNTGYKMGYSNLKWDYGIFGSLFVAPEILQISFPPKGTIYKAAVNEIPLAVLVKRENNFDIDGIAAIRENNIPLATELLAKSYQYDQTNFRIWNYYAYTLLLKGKLNEAKELATKYIELFPDDQLSNQILQRN